MKRLLFAVLSLVLSLQILAQTPTLAERDSIAHDQKFRARVKIAAIQVANQVLEDSVYISVWEYAESIVLEPQSGFLIDGLVYQCVTGLDNPAAADDKALKALVRKEFAKMAGGLTVKSGKPRPDREREKIKDDKAGSAGNREVATPEQPPNPPEPAPKRKKKGN